jgi:broad specificity phosphatase PhoE
MGRVFLIRHGEPDWGDEPRYTGTTDVPLGDLGRRQAERVAERLAGERLDAVYSTGLLRTDATAQAIAGGRGLDVTVVAELAEMDFGEWEDLTRGEIEARYGDLLAIRDRDPETVRCPGGENYQDVAARVVPAFRALAGRHAEDSIAVVGHQATNRTILADALGLPLARVRTIAQAPGTLNLIEIREGRLVAVCVNDTCHLEGLER